MSFKRLLVSKATIWNVTQSTVLGISESTSFSAQVDCRIQTNSGTEALVSGRETNIGSHLIFLESDVSIDTTKQMISAGTIYHIKNVNPIFGRSAVHHLEVAADVIS